MNKRRPESRSNKPSHSRGGRPQGPTRGPTPTRGAQSGERPEFRGQQRAGPSEHKELLKKYPRMVTGHHAVVEAIKKTGPGEGILWLARNWESSKELRELEQMAKEQKIPVEAKPEEMLKSAVGNHQDSCLFTKYRPKWELSESYDQAEEQTIVVLDGVEDPHNLGAVIRTSWLLGVSAVIIPQDRAVGLTATVAKVACGGAEHVPVEIVPNLAQFLEEAKKYEFWVFGLSHKATKQIHQIQIPKKVIWVLGAEDSGMRITTERVCDELVSLPQREKMASFNVSNAAAMALFETARQRIK